MEELTFEQLPRAVALLHNKIDSIEKMLLLQTNSSAAHTEQYLNIKQAAEVLCLSVPTIYGLVQRSIIPFAKRGKRLYFSNQELIDWIKAGRKLTISEIDSQASSFLVNQRKRS
jgi:excisionase family DNA binding protein